MGDFHVRVLSPERSILEGKAHHVLFPGTEGYVGVMADHAPLISEIGIGELLVESKESSAGRYFVSGGMVEVRGDQVAVLVDTIEAADKIDRERAAQAEKRALERLSAPQAIDTMRAQKALARSQNRQRISADHS